MCTRAGVSSVERWLESGACCTWFHLSLIVVLYSHHRPPMPCSVVYPSSVVSDPPSPEFPFRFLERVDDGVRARVELQVRNVRRYCTLPYRALLRGSTGRRWAASSVLFPRVRLCYLSILPVGCSTMVAIAEMKSLFCLRLLPSALPLLLLLLSLVLIDGSSALPLQATMASPSPLADPRSPNPLLDSYPSHPRLSFSPRKTFKLLVLTDTHLLDDGGSPGNASTLNALSTRAVERYLEMEKPDYVVHLGDLVSGEAAKSTQEVEEAVEMILGPMIRRGTPFSTAKGELGKDQDV